MEIYILDNKNLNILSVCRPCNYNLNLDEETNGKSEIVLPSLNYAKKGFYLVLNGLYKQFLFVIDDVITSKEEKAVTVSLLDISNIFDRKIILRDKENMLTNGIENYIANEMDRNFINSSDSILNLNYVDVYVHSTTRANVTINDEDNLYNFHTYLINCRQYKNIYTEFKFEGIINRRLKIDIENKSESTMLIDTTLAEVTGYNKVYEVDPVTKVEAYVREDGSVYNLYLKTDRTTTTNKNDVNRLEGRIETISCDTLENAQEEALNVIRANTYKHLVEFNIAKSSKLIDVKNLHIGRPIKIKTTDSIYDSYISAIILSDENFVQYKTGNLRIDFTDKQRLQKRSGVVGTKLDISGGNVTGTLKVQGKEVSTKEYADNKVAKNGDTMTGDLNFSGNKVKFSNNGGIEFKENGYGDKFRIIPDFSGADDNNILKLQGAVGGAGEDPDFQDLGSFSAKSGNANIKGTITAANFHGKTNGYQWDLGTENTADTWLPVLNGTKIQHRTIPNIIDAYSLKNLSHISNVLDTSITKGFGTYTANTSNIPTGFASYGTVLFLPLADSTNIGHNVILLGNYDSSYGQIAIAKYVNNKWEGGWNYVLTSKKITTGSEIATNEYIDGKQVYIKRIKITSLASNSQYNHGISNFNELIQMYGSAYFTTQGWQPMQRVVTDAIGPYRIRLRRRKFYKVLYASWKFIYRLSKGICNN